MDALVQAWKTASPPTKEAHKVFLRNVKKLDKHVFNATLVEKHQEVFKEIDCIQCANCCKTSPALLNTSDIQRIAKHLQISTKQFTKIYTVEDVNGEISLNRLPCTFLGDDQRCTIYDIRPTACRRFPHTDEMEYAHRPHLNHKNTIVCPAAFHIVQRLQNFFDAP